MRIDARTLAVAAFLVTAVACKTDSTPLCTGSGGAGVLAFTTSRVLNQYDIFTINADGGGVTQITTDYGADDWPAWSHDGTKLAYESDVLDGTTDTVADYNIYVSNADGTGALELTSDTLNEVEPTWSPDGTRIAFARDSAGLRNLWVMNANGSGLRRLTNDSANDAMPAWSPDGGQIAFASDRGSPPNRAAIYVMDTLGGGVTRLTADSATNLSPAWSADGAQLAYHSDRSGDFAIWRMHADGSQQTRFSFTTAPAENASWSPDGTRIAFDADGALWVQTLDGKPAVRITCSNDLQFEPRWHP